MNVPRRAVLTCLALCLCSSHGRAIAATPLTTVRVGSGFSMPLYVTAPPGDTTRLFVVEQRGAENRGRIKIIKGGVTLPTPFLTTDPLATGGEQGLLGLAFAPNYSSTGRFYICYTHANGSIVLQRHTVSGNPDIADTNRAVLLTIAQPFSNHNGGWIGFGPDGYLYMAQGDGGSGGDPGDRAQDIDVLLGKILRLDVSGSGYTIPPTNPYAGATRGADEIFSYGLRNPWRVSFDRETGDLIIGDVGQNVIEEIDFTAAGTGAGANYGWRCFEGSASFAPSDSIPCGSCSAAGCPKTFPAYEYQHTAGRCSVTGGYVYRGCDIPDLRGTYFFGDFCTGEIWSGRFQGGTLADVVPRAADLAPGGGLSINNISSFGEDARGEMYICDHGGEIFKIVPEAAVLEADMPSLQTQVALGDLMGSTAPGNALLPGIVPFADAGSRIRGVGYLRNATLLDCADIAANCLTSRTRLGSFTIDLQACVNPSNGTLTRQFTFTNTATGARSLAYVDVVTPELRGDPDNALQITAAGAGQSAVLGQYESSPGGPVRWLVHRGVGGGSVTYSADVDTISQLAARVAADQPLSGAHTAGPQAVGMALGFDFGSIAAGAQRTVTVTTTYQDTAPTSVDPSPPPAPVAEIRFLSPVPFRTELHLEVGLAQAQNVRLDVFDLSGRRVRTLMRGATPAGRTPSRWDGRLEGGLSAASGIYFLRLESDSWSITRRVALVR